jgi:hypothetical protein
MSAHSIEMGGNQMTKQKAGLVIFWIGVISAIGWGAIGWLFVITAYRNLTMDELSQTMWAYMGFGNYLWGFGIPLGAVVAGIGALLYSGAKGSTVWKYGIGILLALIIAAGVLPTLGHFPPLFGIGGTLILLFFIGILWLWAKERMALKGSSTTAADLKLVGYVFMLIAAFFTCGAAGLPFWKAMEGQAPISPIHLIVLLVLGWLFLFLGHYKSRKQQG